MPIRGAARKEMYKPAVLRLLRRSVFRGTAGEISSQHTVVAARAALLPRRHFTAPWRAAVPGSIQRRLFHNIVQHIGRRPALSQATLLPRRYHTNAASAQGSLPRNSIFIPRRCFSDSAPSRPVSYFWSLLKVAAELACINILISFIYHTYLVPVPYTSRTPFFHLETVPYTNRTHFVVRSPLDEREYGESCFAIVRKNYSSKFLSPLHPDSVRVNLIAAQLLRAVQRGLEIKGCDAALVHGRPCQDTGLDVRHAFESKKGKSCRLQPQITHLDRLDWEVFVIKYDGPFVAVSWPNGKILLSAGLLNYLENDAEIATILGHEIGHVVARHSSESIMYKKWFPYPLRVYFERRMEIEADRMGMLIMAAAGFDPRRVPMIVEKLAGNDIYHPSGKKRAQLLSKAKIMDEALELYTKVMPAKTPEIQSVTGA